MPFPPDVIGIINASRDIAHGGIVVGYPRGSGLQSVNDALHPSPRTVLNVPTTGDVFTKYDIRFDDVGYYAGGSG